MNSLIRLSVPLLVLIILLLGSCSRERVYRGFYEGIRTRDQLETAPPERRTEEEMLPYDRYQEEREKTLKR